MHSTNVKNVFYCKVLLYLYVNMKTNDYKAMIHQLQK